MIIGRELGDTYHLRTSIFPRQLEKITMNETQSQSQSQSQNLQASLHAIAEELKELAASHQVNPQDLLAILRVLESTHQEIRDRWFQNALPDNRQDFYTLLQDIENNGGWPYIERMRLQALLAKLESNPSEPD